jgi:hypothetical protein
VVKRLLAGPMRAERLFLTLAGVVVFALGAWLHRDRATLAIALVVIGSVHHRPSRVPPG